MTLQLTIKAPVSLSQWTVAVFQPFVLFTDDVNILISKTYFCASLYVFQYIASYDLSLQILHITDVHNMVSGNGMNVDIAQWRTT
jgi:hypothetical protein